MTVGNGAAQDSNNYVNISSADTADLFGYSDDNTVTLVQAYDISTSVSPNGAGSVVCQPNPVPDSANSQCTANPKTGYSFSSWSGECSGSANPCTLSAVTQDKSVTASFTLNTYSIGGNVTGLADGQSVVLQNHDGDDKTVTANAPFTFATEIDYDSDYAVTVETQPTGQTCSVTNASGSNVTANVTNVAVNCVTNTYIITETANPSAGGSVSCTPKPVDHGDNSVCTADPETGYLFSSWGGDCSGTTGLSCTLTDVQSAKTVSANFDEIINGACGGADSQATLTAPSSDLCSQGTATIPTATNGGWDWTCEGLNTGTPGPCSAPGAEVGDDANATLAITTDDQNCMLRSSGQADPLPDGGPRGVTLPFGALGFTASTCTGEITVEATYTESVEDLRLYKNINDDWKWVRDATLSGNTVSFTITDNDPELDANSAAGVISDPFGPGSRNGDGGGPAPIPALSGAGLLTLLAGLLGLGGFYARRRR